MHNNNSNAKQRKNCTRNLLFAKKLSFKFSLCGWCCDEERGAHCGMEFAQAFKWRTKKVKEKRFSEYLTKYYGFTMHDNKFFRKYKRKAEKLFVVVNGNFSLTTSFESWVEKERAMGGSLNVVFAATRMNIKRSSIDSLQQNIWRGTRRDYEMTSRGKASACFLMFDIASFSWSCHQCALFIADDTLKWNQ